jgi:hypothetical protein
MRITVLSDIHYACKAEQALRDHEIRAVRNPFTRLALRFFRHYIWLRNPYDQNHLLDQFLERAGEPDFVVANGDYSCNTAFIGVADDAACQSARECLGKLRQRFGKKFAATFGDHELGKISLLGRNGGLRLASWRRCVDELSLAPFWRVEIGDYVLIGVVSTLIALPVFEPEMLPDERAEWQRLREKHLSEIRAAFDSVRPGQKILLFCHDPTAIPFLWREEKIRQRLPQLEQTIIGHLHSPLIFWKSNLLAGMPAIHFLGNSVRRYSVALHEARHWKDFKVRLCPSLAGIELLKDGGYLEMEIDPAAQQPLRMERRKILR